MRIGIIGAGRAGTAMGLALARAGHAVVSVADLDPSRAAFLAQEIEAAAVPAAEVVDAADVILVCVPDARIAPLAAQLAPAVAGMRGKTFLHLSGAHPAGLLGPLGVAGAIGSLHPLLALAEPRAGAARLGQCHYAVEGDPAAMAVAKELAASLGGRVISLCPGDKARYHAAAVMAANLLIGLIDTALGLYEELGLTRSCAREAVWPLIEATLADVRSYGVEAALTGPISRGDRGTIQRHLDVLRGGDGLRLDVYRTLSRATVALAVRAGRISPDEAASLTETLAHD